jgi:hypothetical protein
MKAALSTIVAAGVLAIGCGGTPPTLPESGQSIAPAVAGESGGVTALTGMKTATAAGTLDYVSEDPPGRAVVTPSGMCHFWQYPVYDRFDGDISGPVTFFEQGHGPCDFSHIAGSGPFEAHVTWKGRSGTVNGQWTTNCKADPTSPAGVSCDGTMNGRGHGGLDGVQFHFKWGPGFYPFPYTATVFYK